MVRPLLCLKKTEPLTTLLPVKPSHHIILIINLKGVTQQLLRKDYNEIIRKGNQEFTRINSFQELSNNE